MVNVDRNTVKLETFTDPVIVGTAGVATLESAFNLVDTAAVVDISSSGTVMYSASAGKPVAPNLIPVTILSTAGGATNVVAAGTLSATLHVLTLGA